MTHAHDASFLKRVVAWTLELKSIDRARKAKIRMMHRTSRSSVIEKGHQFLSNEADWEMLVARGDLVSFCSKKYEKKEEGYEKLACLLLA